MGRKKSTTATIAEEKKTPAKKKRSSKKPSASKSKPSKKKSSSKKSKKDIEVAEQNRIKLLLSQREDSVRTRVSAMSEPQVRELLSKVIGRQPGLIFNVLEEVSVNGRADDAFQSNDESPPDDANLPPTAPGPSEEVPWCVCKECRPMPTLVENLCCRGENCVAKSPEFALIALEPMVLNIANGYRNDFFGLIEDQEEDQNRHYRYAGVQTVYHVETRISRCYKPSCDT